MSWPIGVAPVRDVHDRDHAVLVIDPADHPRVERNHSRRNDRESAQAGPDRPSRGVEPGEDSHTAFARELHEELAAARWSRVHDSAARTACPPPGSFPVPAIPVPCLVTSDQEDRLPPRIKRKQQPDLSIAR